MADAKYVVASHALSLARGVYEKSGELPATAFLVRGGRVDWGNPIVLESPSQYSHVAQKHGANTIVLIGQHALVDEDDPEFRLVKLFAGIVNAAGEILIAAKTQRWADQTEWSPANLITGPLPITTPGWIV